MKQLRITVEGKVYDVEVEFLDEEEEETVSGRRSPARGRGRSPGAPAAARKTPPKKAAASESKPEGAAASAGEGDVTSPLGAVVVSVDVAVGDTVEEGQKVVTLEAMKMNTVVTAHRGGKVASIHVRPGDGVEEGRPLLSLE